MVFKNHNINDLIKGNSITESPFTKVIPPQWKRNFQINLIPVFLSQDKYELIKEEQDKLILHEFIRMWINTD